MFENHKNIQLDRSDYRAQLMMLPFYLYIDPPEYHKFYASTKAPGFLSHLHHFSLQNCTCKMVFIDLSLVAKNFKLKKKQFKQTKFTKWQSRTVRARLMTKFKLTDDWFAVRQTAVVFSPSTTQNVISMCGCFYNDFQLRLQLGHCIVQFIPTIRIHMCRESITLTTAIFESKINNMKKKGNIGMEECVAPRRLIHRCGTNFVCWAMTVRASDCMGARNESNKNMQLKG